MSGPIYLVKPELITALAVDIARLMAYGAPQKEDLRRAPLLDQWSVGMPRARGLRGRVTGHPKIEDGTIDTSAAMIIDTERGWVRTMSRYYLLGTQAGG
ncbi:hypothetical protein D9M68_991800 [compost metagenome]